MVAYAFQPQHHANILSGSKTLTMRASTAKRHARVGEVMTFLPGRAKPKFASGECAYRARILFAERGVVRVLDPLFTFDGEPHFRLLQACEQGAPQAAEHLQKLAYNDGFTSWADLVRWHAEQGPYEDGLIPREVIGWSAASVVAAQQ